MITEKTHYGAVKLTAESGMSIRRVGEQGKSIITEAYLPMSEDASKWEDCEYGKPDEPSAGDATEADKDAALRRFGVEV